MVEGVRELTIRGLISAAIDFRAANRYPPDHVMVARLPRWIYRQLSAVDIDALRRANAIAVEERSPGDRW